MNILRINNSEINSNENLAASIQSQSNNISNDIGKGDVIDCIQNDKQSNQSNALSPANKISQITKEFIKSIIPIYGTIREFKKGNIKWGIFGVITGFITLISVIGLGDILAGLLIQACKSIVKIGAIAIEKSKSSKYVAEDKYTKKLSHDTIEPIDNINIPYEPIWHKLSLVNNFHLYRLGRIFFYDFRMLEGNKLYKQLADASKASEFIVNGQNIISSNPNNIIKNLQKIFPNDFRQIQLISSFAQEGIFNKPFTHKILPIHQNNNLKYIAMNGKTSYRINILESGNLILIAKYESRFVLSNGSPNEYYNRFGVKVSTVISKDVIPEFNYSYYFI